MKEVEEAVAELQRRKARLQQLLLAHRQTAAHQDSPTEAIR